MAINLIKINEFPESVDTKNWMVVADANGISYKISIDNVKAELGIGALMQYRGSVVPTSDVQPAGDFFVTATEAGTYTNYGGVVVPANSFAVISRVGGVYASSITEIILDGYAKESDVILLDEIKLLNTSEFPTPIPNTNLFNKNTIIEGSILNSSGLIIPGTGAVSDYIYVGDSPEIWVLRTWAGAPQGYAWYDIDKNFIQYSTGTTLPVAPGGALTIRPLNGRYILLNVSNDPANTVANANALMVYNGNRLIDYKPFYFFPDIELQHDEMIRKDSYSKIINAMYRDSSLNYLSEVSDGMIGHWIVREDRGATAVKNEDYITLTIDGTATGQQGTNSGLIMYDFFRDIEAGMNVYFKFEARLISGYSTYSLYANGVDDSLVNIDIEQGDFKTYQASAIVGSTYADKRLVIGVAPNETASEIEIRNFQVYFTKPFDWEINQDYYIPENFNLSTLPNFNYKKEGVSSQTLVLGIQGDSWTDHVPGAIFYARDLSRILRAKYGDGGGGWYDFANSQGSASNQRMASIDPDDANDTRSGTITYKDHADTDALGVNFAHALFANGASITLNVLTAHTQFMISYYAGSSYGQFRYRIDGGAWNNVNAATVSGHQTIIADVSDSTHVLDFEVTSGNVILFGVDMRRQGGIRVHKLGNRGLLAMNIPDFNAAVWKSQLASLQLDTITILLGTNDKTVDRIPQLFKADMRYFVDMCRDAIPFIDIVLISPSNNKRNNSYNMYSYAAMLKELAEEKNVSFLNLIPLFGSTALLIDKGTFYDNDHPTEQGGVMIANYLANSIFI